MPKKNCHETPPGNFIFGVSQIVIVKSEDFAGAKSGTIHLKKPDSVSRLEFLIIAV